MTQPLRILHLEDDPLDTELVQRLLRAEGLAAQIERVDTLAGFQDALEHGCYALILSDYTLPGTDPMEALRLARRLCPQVPFIFLSGTMGEDTAIESLKMGASDYVLKQRMARLAPAVRRALAEAEEQVRRQRAEEALRESEFHLARAQEMAHLGSWSWDIPADRLQWSDETYRLFGLQPGQFAPCYKDFLGFVHPEDRPRVEQSVHEALVQGRYSLDFHIVQRGGQERCVHGEGQTAFDSSGKAIKMEGTVLDITERKQVEAELREANQNYRALFNNHTVALAHCRTIFDDSGKAVDYVVLDVNAAYEKQVGVKREELVGKKVTEAFPGVSRDLIDRHNQVAVTGRESHFETYVPTIDKWFDVNVFSPQKGYFVALSYNITARKQAEEALRELNATLESKVTQRTAELERRARQLQKLTLELSQAEERERRRIAVILHEDLQQQIAGAKFHLSLVRNRTREDRQRTDIDSVDAMLKEAIEKSRTLSRDLSPAVMHMNDLTELLQWLANRLRAQQGLSVELDIAGDMMLHSEALGTFLFRAAQEMLFNVVKHAHVREAAIRVRRIRGHVCLSVSDQGRGFDPQELKETSGMGLFGIRERVELLGGRMKVKSAQGKGSRFSITVPDGPKPEDRRQKTDDSKWTAEGEPDPSAALRRPSSDHALRVLLVDDHDVVRAGLAALLQEAPGIELVGEAPDGRKAIDMTLDLQPDVVIMDVSMPLMSGDQATRQIKAYLPKTRVIALSMYDDVDKKESMFEAGADGYILKTVSAEELLAAIRGMAADS